MSLSRISHGPMPTKKHRISPNFRANMIIIFPDYFPPICKDAPVHFWYTEYPGLTPPSMGLTYFATSEVANEHILCHKFADRYPKGAEYVTVDRQHISCQECLELIHA